MRGRTLLRYAGAMAVAGALPRSAFALDYPTHAARLVVPFTPGGGADITARLIAQWLSDHLGQAFVVENKPGAGSNLGTETVVTAAPDGYTLLLINAGNAINATLYQHLSFDFIRDIEPVCSIVRGAACHVRHAVVSGQNGGRVHRLCQSQSRQSEFRFGRRRQRQPHLGGDVQDDDRASTWCMCRSTAARRRCSRSLPATSR